MNDVEVTQGDGEYIFHWTEPDVTFQVTDLWKEHHQTHCYIQVTCDLPGIEPYLHGASFNISSTSTRKTLAKELEERLEAPWRDWIEAICQYVYQAERQGEPIVEISPQKPLPEEEQYRLFPLLPQGQNALIYGDGGSFKSYIAGLFSVMVALPTEGLKLPTPIYGKVLYLDYETSQDEHEWRLWRIVSGLGHDPDHFVSVYYQRRSSPITEGIAELRRFVRTNDIGFIVVDSVAQACGGDIEKQEPVSQMCNDLRSLRTTNLLLGHVPKNDSGDSRRGKTPYGSAFWRNNVRSAWEAKATQEPGASEADLGLFHRKANNSKIFKPIGVHILFEGDSVFFQRNNLRNVPELAGGLSVSDRILGCLKDHGLLA